MSELDDNKLLKLPLNFLTLMSFFSKEMNIFKSSNINVDLIIFLYWLFVIFCSWDSNNIIPFSVPSTKSLLFDKIEIEYIIELISSKTI